MYGGEVMPGRGAGSGVGKYYAESPKQGSKGSTVKYDETLCPSGYVIYLWDANISGTVLHCPKDNRLYAI